MVAALTAEPPETKDLSSNAYNARVSRRFQDMSVRAILAAFDLQTVSSAEKLLLLALANYANDERTCWPSQETLSHDTKYNARSIRRLMLSLEKKGEIVRRPRYSKQGRSSDAYTLLFVPLAVLRSGKVAVPRSAGSGQQVYSVADRRTGEPVIEPRIEPCARETEPLDGISRAQMSAGLKELAQTLRSKRA